MSKQQFRNSFYNKIHYVTTFQSDGNFQKESETSMMFFALIFLNTDAALFSSSDW